MENLFHSIIFPQCSIINIFKLSYGGWGQYFYSIFILPYSYFSFISKFIGPFINGIIPLIIYLIILSYSINSLELCISKIFFNNINNHFFDLKGVTYYKGYSDNHRIYSYHVSPFLSTLFFVLLVINLNGLLPHTFCFNIFVTNTLTLTLIIFIATFYIAYKNFNTTNTNLNYKNTFLGVNYFPEGTPLWLAPLIIPVEIISHFIRPFSMGFRISGNIFAGHILMTLLVTTLITVTYIVFPLFLYYPIIWLSIFTAYSGLFFMEICVSFIQAYVLTLLSSTFLSETETLH